MDTLARLIPYTRDAYLRLFDSYNEAIWPAQLAAYALCALIVWSLFRPVRGSAYMCPALLGFSWLWIGGDFHLQRLAQLNWAAWLFGALVVLQGLLLLIGTLRRRLVFAWRSDAAAWGGAIFIAAALVAYPLAGAAMGLNWRSIGYAGVAPAPTILLTLGLLLLVRDKTPLHLFVLPAVMSCVVGARGLVIGLPLDAALPIAAAAAVTLALIRGRVSQTSAG